MYLLSLSLCTLAYRLCLLTQATCKFGEAKGTKGQANASKLGSQVNSFHFTMHGQWPRQWQYVMLMHEC